MMPIERHDLIIIGAGPAGLSAAIYASRSLLDFVIIEQESVGGQALLTSEIDNYPGVPHVNGMSLSGDMEEQATELGVDIRTEMVASITRNDDGTFSIVTDMRKYLARCVILATGASPRLAGFDGEKRFAGRGVSYCATCDGMFYKGKPVFVIGGGNSAAEEALFLTRFASHVTMVVRKGRMRAQASVKKQVEGNPKIDVLYGTTISSVSGDDKPDTIVFRDVSTGRETMESFEPGAFGIFVFVGSEPESGIIAGIVDTNDDGYVVTDETMATGVAGLYVAGDVREKPLRQIVTAVSDGAIAATSAAAYLAHDDNR